MDRAEIQTFRDKFYEFATDPAAYDNSKIICSEEKTFHIHPTILLALGSKYLSDVYIIPDIRHEELEFFFRALFSRETELDVESLGKVGRLLLGIPIEILPEEEEYFVEATLEDFSPSSISENIVYEHFADKESRFLVCKICYRILEKYESFLTHIYEQHDESSRKKVKIILDVPLDKCPICSVSTPNFSSLINHLNTHHRLHSKKYYKCQACDFKSHHLPGFKSHERSRHKKRVWICENCRKSFAREDLLRIHEKSQNCSNKQCPDCLKIFSNKARLQAHLKSHAGLRPFKCSKCGKAFAQKRTLHEHELTHSAVRLFNCTICDKRFVQKNHLLSHSLRIHGVSSKPISHCQFCDKVFAFPYQLKNHIEAYHIEKEK